MIPKINSNKVVNDAKKTIERNKMSEKSYNEYIYKMVSKITNRAEREVPEYGDFAPVYEEFKNQNKNLQIDRYQLKILKMPKSDVADEKQRFIQATVFPKYGNYKADMLISGGDKNKILNDLKNKDFLNKLNEAYIKLVDMIENPA